MAWRLESFHQLVLFRLRTFYREPGIMFWVFVFPVIALGAFGLAFRPGAPARYEVGVIGDATARAALEPVSELHVRALADDAEGARALARGEVVLVVVASAPPRFRFDPARQEALVARLLVEKRWSALRDPAGPPAPILEPVGRSGVHYVDYLVPGLIGMQIMNTTLLGVGLSLVEMRARRMLRRFAVTPVPRAQLLLAQVASRLSFTWVMALMLLLIARVAFSVEVRGSLLDVAVLVLLGGLSFAGISLAVAARISTMETAQGVVTLIAVPMVLLSGVFFSTSGFPFGTAGMPAWIRGPASFLPLAVLNEALRAVVNEGASLPARAVALLLAWGAAPFLVALRFFRWT